MHGLSSSGKQPLRIDTQGPYPQSTCGKHNDIGDSQLSAVLVGIHVAGVDEQPAAIIVGNPVTDLNDTQLVKGRRPFVGYATHAAIYTFIAKIARPTE